MRRRRKPLDAGKLFGFLTHEARMQVRDKPGYVVRLFDHKGWYPKGKFATRDALYWAERDLVFMVTLSQPWDQSTSTHYSEMDWATAQELRLLASIMLCETEDGPMCKFYPFYRFSMQLDAASVDLSSQRVARRIKDSLYMRSLHPNIREGEDALLHSYQGLHDLLPRKGFEFQRHAELFAAISPTDYLFLRGIAALIKSSMLSNYTEFVEEAIISAFIALEVSFRMVCRYLESQGMPHPDPGDAAKWLHDTFNAPFFETQDVERYFEESFEQRVMTLHPRNRYGVTPLAPLMFDDFGFLRRSLPPIFAYLLTGRHSADYLDRVQRFGRRQRSW